MSGALKSCGVDVWVEASTYNDDDDDDDDGRSSTSTCTHDEKEKITVDSLETLVSNDGEDEDEDEEDGGDEDSDNDDDSDDDDDDDDSDSDGNEKHLVSSIDASRSRLSDGGDEQLKAIGNLEKAANRKKNKIKISKKNKNGQTKFKWNISEKLDLSYEEDFLKNVGLREGGWHDEYEDSVGEKNMKTIFSPFSSSSSSSSSYFLPSYFFPSWPLQEKSVVDGEELKTFEISYDQLNDRRLENDKSERCNVVVDSNNNTTNLQVVTVVTSLGVSKFTLPANKSNNNNTKNSSNNNNNKINKDNNNKANNENKNKVNKKVENRGFQKERGQKVVANGGINEVSMQLQHNRCDTNENNKTNIRRIETKNGTNNETYNKTNKEIHDKTYNEIHDKTSNEIHDKTNKETNKKTVESSQPPTITTTMLHARKTRNPKRNGSLKVDEVSKKNGKLSKGKSPETNGGLKENELSKVKEGLRLDEGLKVGKGLKVDGGSETKKELRTMQTCLLEWMDQVDITQEMIAFGASSSSSLSSQPPPSSTSLPLFPLSSSSSSQIPPSSSHFHMSLTTEEKLELSQVSLEFLHHLIRFQQKRPCLSFCFERGFFICDFK